MRWVQLLFRPVFLLGGLALMLTLGAIWLAAALPGEQTAEPPSRELPSDPLRQADMPPPEADPQSTPAVPVPIPPAESLTEDVGEPEPATEEGPPPGDWLDPYYGLTDPDDIEAMRVLLVLVDTLDFSRFWQDIRPLANRDNTFAQYLILALRDFMVLDDDLLQFGYVEEPYLNQNRRHLESPNWVHWLYANWRPSWEPDEEQISQAFERALAGNEAAQTLLISRTGWFQSHPRLASNLDELLDRLAGNRYLQTMNLLQLNIGTIAQAGSNDAALSGLRQRLGSSSHPLSQWLAGHFDESFSVSSRRAQLLDLAQQGYLTAIQEVRRLALTGQGRWTDDTLTPVSLNDAIQVHQQLASQHPTNPLVSVALCELHLANGDYQASWNYLHKFAYEDDWSEEVEDYSCNAGGHDRYGELMIERGVITESQWQQHLDTIDERRRRIRG
ncbi:MAG: hypothetical protein LAT62_05995 [Natronospirillum sp.]|uniref:hypothetical protein n=1 Tax=Natronospirillum sp. TaxID=2812955 RepID=UPI0025DEDE65|nr:hypothetical protein [Natronospirillum sp.]MCH8551467.1 hypothetical protein [Natronospirillum sp.]